MSVKTKLAFSLGVLAGFAVLAALFAWLNGWRDDGPGLLAAAAALSVFTLWAASTRSHRT